MAAPVVSSAHLAAGASPALSEVEYGMILAGHAFQRWMVVCAATAGAPGQGRSAGLLAAPGRGAAARAPADSPSQPSIGHVFE